jgi:hypothetical protein
MPLRNGGRPPPLFAGNGLPIELPTRALAAKFNATRPPSQDAARIPRERLACLTRAIYRLGERPLLELFLELDRGAPLHPALERYGGLAPLGGFIRSLGGDRLPSPRIVAGRRR